MNAFDYFKMHLKRWSIIIIIIVIINYLIFKVQYFPFHGHYLPLTLSRIIIIIVVVVVVAAVVVVVVIIIIIITIIIIINIKTQFVHLW